MWITEPLRGQEASSLSGLNCGVEALELDPRILSGETPVDPTTRCVAGRLPRRDLPLQGRPIGQPAVQALLGQHGKLDLGHVQPAAMLGRVVQLQPIGGAAWPPPAGTPRTARWACGC